MCQISKIIQYGYSIVANLQQYGQMLQKFYYFIFPFLSPLSSFFLFSSLSLSGSLSFLPIQVPSLFDQSGMFTGSDDRHSSDDDNAFRHTRSHPRSSHAWSCRSHPRSISPISPQGHCWSHPLRSPLCPPFTLPLSSCGFFFLLQFGLI